MESYSLSVVCSQQLGLFVILYHAYVFTSFISVLNKYVFILHAVYSNSDIWWFYGGGRRRIKSSVTEEPWSRVFPGGSDKVYRVLVVPVFWNRSTPTVDTYF